MEIFFHLLSFCFSTTDLIIAEEIVFSVSLGSWAFCSDPDPYKSMHLLFSPGRGLHKENSGASTKIKRNSNQSFSSGFLLGDFYPGPLRLSTRYLGSPILILMYIAISDKITIGIDTIKIRKLKYKHNIPQSVLLVFKDLHQPAVLRIFANRTNHL